MRCIFECQHASIGEHPSGYVQVTFERRIGAMYESRLRAALVLSKHVFCDCCTAWGLITLGKEMRACSTWPEAAE